MKTLIYRWLGVFSAAGLAVGATVFGSGAGQDPLDGMFKGTVDKAVEAYSNGDYGDAVAQLRQAEQFACERRGEIVVSRLPKALPGWMPLSTFSDLSPDEGGVFSERIFSKGQSSVAVRIHPGSVEAGMLQDALTRGESDFWGRVEAIGEQKWLFSFDEVDRSGKVRSVVSGSVITITGTGCAAEDLRAYAAAIDLRSLDGL